jgi:hypothetical protein
MTPDINPPNSLMKPFCVLLSLTVLLLFNGCTSPQSVSHLRGQGTKSLYNAPYDRVWSAAVAACQNGDLIVLITDKPRGFISVKRNIRPTTLGENVAIWVRQISPTQTEVEVVSRQAGPPVFVIRNWEHYILDGIAANLTT